MQTLKLTLSQIFKTPEKAFLSIGLLFGIIFLLIIPPFQVPDEFNHFMRSYQISEGQLIAEKRGQITGGFIPKSLVDFTGIWYDIPFKPQQKATKKQFFESFKIPLNRKKKVFGFFPNTALYSPVAYLPQAIGINLGKVFDLYPVILMYLGRLTNLLISVYLIFLAIKITPVFQWVFFLLALTPMATFQRASLSADSLLNSVSILMIAILIKYAFDVNQEKIFKNDILIVGILSVVVALCKQAYFPISFLYFLIPKYKIGSRKKYFIVGLFIILISAFAWFYWSFVVKGLYVPMRPDVVTSADEQAHFILSQPLKYAIITFNDFNVNLDEYFKQFIGVLGWVDTPVPGILQISYAPILVFIALIDSRRDILILLKDKLIIFAAFLSSIFLIYLLNYLAWNPVGEEKIAGLQGRHFIPIAPLLW